MNSALSPIRKETRLLMHWYDAKARELPWRVGPRSNKKPVAYHVWLSEIMLQQTQVATVKVYFEKFLMLWPTLPDLAAADLEDVLKAWAGLGYYSRARNLKKCADIVQNKYDGELPGSAAELAKLPGIGPYTSAAIAAITCGEQIAVIDGNVERVISRIYKIATPLPKAKSEISRLTGALVPSQRSGDFAQAMMDLGATICSPQKPQCNLCPWRENCGANTDNQQEDFPVKTSKKKVPTRIGAAFVAMDPNGRILLRKRSDTGMLAGMSEVPSSDWSAQQDGETGIDAAPFSGDWYHVGDVRHVFTHFKLEMKVYFCATQIGAETDGWWVDRNLVMDEALPELMKKVIRLAIRDR